MWMSSIGVAQARAVGAKTWDNFMQPSVIILIYVWYTYASSFVRPLRSWSNHLKVLIRFWIFFEVHQGVTNHQLQVTAQFFRFSDRPKGVVFERMIETNQLCGVEKPWICLARQALHVSSSSASDQRHFWETMKRWIRKKRAWHG